MNDYIIAFDENGSPYIAHAFWNRKKDGQKKDHKYIQRVKGKNGLWRYFYDQAEWDAYVRGDTHKVTSLGGKIKDKIGYDERARKSNAGLDYMKADDERIAAEKRYEKAKADVDKQENFGSYLKRKLNKKSAEDFNNALAKKNQAAEEMLEAQRKHKNADYAYNKAIREYENTPLGKLETAQENIDNAKDVIADAADQSFTNALLYMDKVEGKVRDRIQEHRDTRHLKEDEKFLNEIGSQAAKIGNRVDKVPEGGSYVKDKYTWYNGEVWETEKLVNKLYEQAGDLYEKYEKAESDKERRRLRKEIKDKYDFMDQLIA